MQVAAIYDIHGNLPALEAVLEEIDSIGVDRIVVGGDMIPGPFPNETINLLRSITLPTYFISGNGERETIALLDGKETNVPKRFHDELIWNGRQLDAAQRDFIVELASNVKMELPALGEIMFCHATPSNDSDIFTKNTAVEVLAPIFKDCPNYVVCGHTHMQFDRMIGNVRVLNAGSVGMAFGASDAQWLLIEDCFELRNTSYDKPDAIKRIHASKYPDAENFIARYVASHPSESEMLALFESASIGDAG